MRHQIKKLTKRHSTKAERRFMELLKKLHIPFRAKVVVEGREVDFIIGPYAIEIDAHAQDVLKNEMLMRNGYMPIHISNRSAPVLEEWLKQIYGSSSRNRSIHPDLGSHKRGAD